MLATRKKQPDSRFVSLMNAWSYNIRETDQLRAKIGALGPTGGMKPSVFRKLTRMLEQIGVLQAQERDIISEINVVEAEHRFRRKNNLLKQPKPKPAKTMLDNEQNEETPEPSRNFWVAFLLFWSLSNDRINNKKQGPASG